MGRESATRQNASKWRPIKSKRSARSIGKFRVFFSIHETATHLAQSNYDFDWYLSPECGTSLETFDE
jgi:hypothetical protein